MIHLHSQITKTSNKLVISKILARTVVCYYCQYQLLTLVSIPKIENNSPVCNFIFEFGARQNNHLSYISALLREHARSELEVKKFEDLELKNAHPDNYTSDKEILQKEKQLLNTGNLYLSSPYSISKQTTNVLLPSRNVESYTKTKLVT